jgi:predicted TIM-barrel fold metal-dependent hydrolase
MGKGMSQRQIRAHDLRGKTIDVHTHVGVNVQAYARLEFPYCQSLEGLYYKQKANGVDYSVVFPFSGDLYFDIATLVREGRMVPAVNPISDVPYERENRLLLMEIFSFCPEYRQRFIPFVCVDPVRKVGAQLDVLRELELEFPFYGIKVSPVGCQSKITGLLEEGEGFIDFARQRNLPFLFHTTVHPEESYSQVVDALRVVEAHPDLRFCLAHCIGLHRAFLERADGAPNAWVDTAALKIQVQLAYENNPIMAPPQERWDWDYSSHIQIMRELVEHFPGTILWGSDAPAYAYICRRQQAPRSYVEFRLKANYEDEVAALQALAPEARKRVSATNIIRFLFGAAQADE